MTTRLILLNIDCGPKWCNDDCQGLQEMDTLCGVFLQTLDRRHGKSRRCTSCIEAEAGSEQVWYFAQDFGWTGVDPPDLEKHLEKLARGLHKERQEHEKTKVTLQKERALAPQDTPGSGQYCPNRCKHASSLRKSGYCAKYHQQRTEHKDPKWRKHRWIRLPVCREQGGEKEGKRSYGPGPT